MSKKSKIRPGESVKMTVHQLNEEYDRKSSPWPGELSVSSSWDGNSQATSSSWPEGIEEAATRRVLNSWYAIERTLYKEDEELTPGDLLEECIQWRTQIPHFRVVGKRMTIEAIEEKNSETASVDLAYNNISSADKHAQDESIMDTARKKLRGKVVNRLVKYICEELEKEEMVNEYSSPITKDLDQVLDQVLTITPAPSFSGRQLNNRKKVTKSPRRKNSSANKFESFQLTELSRNMASSRSQKIDNHSIDDSTIIDDDTDRPESTVQLSRNKLGTVFNKKIVVSPVPYAVTTRESFCTLKTTPIRYAGHLLELTTPKGANRNMKSASRAHFMERASLLRVPQRHSAWQTSVCPSVWPKNVRLAPIDPARLPSSKNRSLLVTTSVPQRNRNSLSPISRPLQKATSAADTLNGENYLGIQGKPIVTRSARPNFSKTGWDYNLQTYTRNMSKKSRSKSDR